MSVSRNRRMVLASRPVGVPRPQHFRRADVPVPAIDAGFFLVHNLYLSVDPAQLGWVNADSNYSDTVSVGAVMRSLALDRVERSNHPEYAEGDFVYGWFGWQDFCVAGPVKFRESNDDSWRGVSIHVELCIFNTCDN